ncbi:MAG: LLM class flavin-dependent oxidoreductase [Candidatus Binataceae bacterium]
MPGLGVSLSTFSRMPYADFADLAREAEDSGFSAVFVPEANNDAMMCCYAIAQATKKITLGTRIINIYLRSPLLCGAGAMMLQEQSDGRFVLGLGVGHRTLLKAVGIEMGNAREYLQRYMGLLTKVLKGESIPNIAYQFRASPKRVPVYFAALAIETARLGGELADGLMLYMCPPARMAKMIAAARASATKAGRQPADISITMGLSVFLDDNLKDAYAAAKRDLAFYAGLDFYNRVWAASGFEKAAAECLTAARRGDRAGISAAMTEPMIDAVALAGPLSRCLERLREYRASGAEMPVLVTHAVRGDYVSALRQNLKAFARAI